MRRFVLAFASLILSACGGGGGGGGAADAGTSPAGCLPGRACAASCSDAAPCGGTEACTSGLCAQPLATSTQYAACTLDAECPRGDYCSLGACSHDCVADRDCQGGTVCSDRGRCIAATQVGQAPVVAPPAPGAPAVSPALLDFGASVQTLTFSLTNAGASDFDFRLLSSRKWSSAEPATGTVPAGKSTIITVTLDRKAAQADGAQGGFIGVNTTAGYLRVNLAATLDMSGAWAGALTVTSPLALGTQGLTVNLSQSGSSLFGWVDEALSLLYPLRAIVSGEVLPSGGTDAVSFGFDLPSPAGDSLNPALPRDVIRHFTFVGTRTDATTLTGTFTESFDGILEGQQTQISGTAVFRLSGPAPEGGPDIAPAVTVGSTPNPLVDGTGALKAPYQACTVCPGGGSCSTEATHALAFFQERDGASNPKLAFYNAFWQAANTGTWSPFTYTRLDACVLGGSNCSAGFFDAQSLRCAQYWGWKGGGNTASYLLDGLEVPADAGLYVGNAYLARAFDAFYNPVSSLGEQAGVLAQAEQTFVAGLHSESQDQPIAPLDPFFAKVLARFGAGVAAQNAGYSLKAAPVNADDSDRGPGEHVRRALQSIERALFAANQRSDLLRRAQKDPEAELALREAAVRTWLDLATIAPVLATSPSTWTADAEPITTGLADASRRHLAIRQNRNLFGYGPEYVPFFWASNNIASGATNFLQILATAETNQATWKELNAEASANLRTFESTANGLTTELASQLSAIDNQLRDVCGEAVTTADTCGQAKVGQLWDAILELRAVALRLESIEQQTANVHESIKIEESRAAQVAGLHENQAVLIVDTSHRVYADEKAIRTIEAETRQAHGFLSAVSGVLGALANPNPNPGAAMGAIVQGIGGAIIDGMAAQNIEDYEKDKAEAIATERAQVEYNAAQEQLIDSAARVKAELLQLSVLKIDHDIALFNAVQVKARMAELLLRTRSLLQEKARVKTMSNRNARYAIHYRVVASAKSRKALATMDEALRSSYYATRALEYQLASEYRSWADLWTAREPSDLLVHLTRLKTAASQQRTSQSNRDVISLRDDVLGLAQTIHDPVTGAEISPRERFRRFVANPSNWDARGNLRIAFATDSFDQKLFSSAICSDRIQTVRANLIGDSLGARVADAYVQVVHGGTSYLRSCTRQSDGTTKVIAYDMTGSGNAPVTARVHAAVNGTTNGTPGMDPDVELHERAVLASSWELVIDLHDNPGLNVFGLDDIELTIEHDSYTIQ